MGHVKFKGSLTKWPVQKQTYIAAQKHAEHQDATDIQNILFVFFLWIFLFLNKLMLTGHVRYTALLKRVVKDTTC